MSFHIDKNGNPRKCTAKKRCPYGSRHYTTDDEAYTAAEKVSEAKAKGSFYIRSTTDMELLGNLANSTDVKILKAVAGNKNTPSDVLRRLVVASDHGVRRTALLNPSIRSKDLRTLLSDRSSMSPRFDLVRTRLAVLESSKQVKADADAVFKSLTEPDGGATWNPLTGEVPTSGFCYSPYPQYSVVFPVPEKREDFDDRISDFLNSPAADLLTKPNHYIGLWNNPADGKIYLDVSVSTMDAESARKECLTHDQIAFFDLQTFDSVTVNSKAKSGQDS